ncbi:aldose epimerase family protein [Aquimarina sp. 2201CG5-10]|uniref:aldose epimerase family protein n=1 Tax=Aquimarina callyspongiae TaxID=3098150 RepID=UPI002AC96D6A|nr:aldose epimerase family protein [Aquimarina sp. 2201CG5-10]
MRTKSFGFHDQKEVFVIELKNDKGSRLRITNFGATIMSLEIPDKNGRLTNVVIGFDTLKDYIEKSKNKESKFLGASIGRHAGRISNGEINVNNTDYVLYQEEGIHLHGGKMGFDSKVWEVDSIDEEALLVSFSYLSEHLEEGYPGNLHTKVTYQLTNTNELKITYKAVSDQDTVINLTNHAYYNLSGSDTIANHILQLNSHSYLEINGKQLPTGKIKPVVNTKLDFLNPKRLNGLLEFGIIDNTLIFDQEKKVKATLYSQETGIKMDVHTNQPGVVIYTPEKFPEWNFRKAARYNLFPAICFEVQNYPDAPSHSNFPSSFLKTGIPYENHSVFAFSILKD